MLPTALIGAVLVVVGTAVTLLGAYQLGVARAARAWEPAGGRSRFGRGIATVGALVGLILLAGGAGTLVRLAELPRVTPAGRTGIAVAAGVVVLGLGMYGAGKLADRVELNTLIRTPARYRRLPAATSPPAIGAGEAAPVATGPDPVVPPTARAGWVYRDADGAWYLAVSSGTGYRLVSLPDFTLVPVGAARPPVTVTGSVELTVWPLADPDSGRHDPDLDADRATTRPAT